MIYTHTSKIFSKIEQYVWKHKIWTGHFLEFTCYYGILETLQTYQEYIWILVIKHFAATLT